MSRAAYGWTLVMTVAAVLASGLTCAAAKGPEVTDPKVAAEDPDFHVQGEYVGEGTLPDETRSKVGAQVVALGGGEFDLAFFKGGLPGAGWQRGDGQMKAKAKRDGDVTTIEGDNLQGKIAGGKMTISDNSGKAKVELERTERKSPTLGQDPADGAVVIFRGPDDAKNFDHAELTDDGNVFSGVTTKQEFDGKGYQLHLEFRLSWMPQARGQGRSNSGVYVNDCYEIQVLDSFGLEGKNNECGGLYSIAEPKVNMCLPPLVWQTYDIDFTAPVYEGDKKVKNAHLVVRHNGEVIQDLELPKGTPGRKPEGPGPRPLHLQGHGNKVQYRNVWLVEKK